MKKLLLSLLLISSTLLAQDSIPEKRQKNRIPFKERLFIAPDLGLQFGTVTLVHISPKVGYRITDRFAAGLGGTYIYYNDKTYKSYGYTFESNSYGGSVFAQYQLFEAIRLYSEYELLSIETFDFNSLEYERRLVPGLLAGAGYNQAIGGGNSSFGIMLLYNLLDGPYSLYENPIIRVGFNIGF